MNIRPQPLAAAALLLWLAALLLPSALGAQSAGQGTDAVSRERVLRDPDIPATGNPNGDITVVEFFDYQCPYCKALHPYFKKAVEEDGKVRVVSKSWPIFGDISVYAARLVLATKYQNKYAEAHEALISATAKLDEARVQEVLSQAGVDIKRAQNDLQKNAQAIDAALARTNEQAEILGFRGTPSFIFNTLRFSGVLDAEGFKAAFADARKAAKAKK
jgi:protein-disulfide isomerase